MMSQRLRSQSKKKQKTPYVKLFNLMTCSYLDKRVQTKKFLSILLSLKKAAESSNRLKSAISCFSLLSFYLNPAFEGKRQNEITDLFFEKGVVPAKNCSLTLIKTQKSKEEFKIVSNIASDLLGNLGQWTGKVLTYPKNRNRYDDGSCGLGIYSLDQLSAIGKSRQFFDLPSPQTHYIWIITENMRTRDNTRDGHEAKMNCFFKMGKNKDSMSIKKIYAKSSMSKIGKNTQDLQGSIQRIEKPRNPSSNFTKITREAIQKLEIEEGFKEQRSKSALRDLTRATDEPFSNVISRENKGKKIRFEGRNSSIFSINRSPKTFHLPPSPKKQRSMSKPSPKRFRIDTPNRSRFNPRERRRLTRGSFLSQSLKIRKKRGSTHPRKSNPESNRVTVVKMGRNLLLESLMKDKDLENDEYQLERINERLEKIKRGFNSNEIMLVSMLKTKASSLCKRIKGRMLARKGNHQWKPVVIDGVHFQDATSYEKHQSFIQNSMRHRKLTQENKLNILNFNNN